MNFNSSDIKIYPAANRNVSYDPYADLLLEQNITNQIKNITDYPSYIIEGLDITEWTSSNLGLVVNSLQLGKGRLILNGYYIDILKDITIVDDIKELKEYPCYVYIALVTQENNGVTQIQGIDKVIGDNDIYTGVNVIISTDAQKDTNYFKIAEIRKNTSGSISIIPTPKGMKYKAENTKISLLSTSGLVEKDYSGTFGNWINNEFIIDDENI